MGGLEFLGVFFFLGGRGCGGGGVWVSFRVSGVVQGLFCGFEIVGFCGGCLVGWFSAFGV